MYRGNKYFYTNKCRIFFFYLLYFNILRSRHVLLIKCNSFSTKKKIKKICIVTIVTRFLNIRILQAYNIDTNLLYREYSDSCYCIIYATY